MVVVAGLVQRIAEQLLDGIEEVLEERIEGLPAGPVGPLSLGAGAACGALLGIESGGLGTGGAPADVLAGHPAVLADLTDIVAAFDPAHEVPPSSPSGEHLHFTIQPFKETSPVDAALAQGAVGRWQDGSAGMERSSVRSSGWGMGKEYTPRWRFPRFVPLRNEPAEVVMGSRGCNSRSPRG
jgi:hypothetical protein